MSLDASEERRVVLRRCRLFAALPGNQLALLAEMMRVERFGAGEIVCESGDPADAIYVIAEGELQVFLPGRDAAVRTMRSGDVFGEYGMFRHTRTSTVRATVDATLMSLDYERFRAYLLRCPEALMMLLETAVARMLEREAGA